MFKASECPAYYWTVHFVICLHTIPIIDLKDRENAEDENIVGEKGDDDKSLSIKNESINNGNDNVSEAINESPENKDENNEEDTEENSTKNGNSQHDDDKTGDQTDRNNQIPSQLQNDSEDEGVRDVERHANGQITFNIRGKPVALR